MWDLRGEQVRRVMLAATLTAGPWSAGGAAANDSVVHLAAGGLVLSRTQDIEMVSEDLFVSEAEIRVHYVFRNKTVMPVTTLVAFPLSALRAPSDVDNLVIPLENRANFLGFETAVDCRPVPVEIEQRVRALGIAAAAPAGSPADGSPSSSPLAPGVPALAGASGETWRPTSPSPRRTLDQGPSAPITSTWVPGPWRRVSSYQVPGPARKDRKLSP